VPVPSQNFPVDYRWNFEVDATVGEQRCQEPFSDRSQAEDGNNGS